MRIVLTCFLSCFFLACGQNKKEVSLLFKPQGKMTYSYTMSSDVLNMNGTIEADFNTKKDSVDMAIEITALSSTDRENKDLGHSAFIGSTYNRVYDIYGKALDLDEVPKQVINTDLFVIEFPKTPITEGTTWKGKKTAKPDMFFDSIAVDYTCTLIKEDIVFIKADMDFVTHDKASSAMNLKRKYKGEYIVDRKDGHVIAAQLYLEMFSGFSNLSGKIEITKM